MKLIHLLSHASHALHDCTRDAIARFFTTASSAPVMGFDHGIDPP